jgi:hypothetical protein
MTMNRYSAALAGVGLLSAMVTAGCDRGVGGEEYATRREFEALRAQYAATHDTMLSLWRATDSVTRLLGPYIDTTSPPPKCPPRCMEIIPPLPRPYTPYTR